MSDTTTIKAIETKAADITAAAVNTVMASPAGVEPTWAKPAVAIGSMVLFGGMTAVSILTKNNDSTLMLVGAVITMATSSVNYYLGSSAGSARKTEIAAVPAVK